MSVPCSYSLGIRRVLPQPLVRVLCTGQASLILKVQADEPAARTAVSSHDDAVKAHTITHAQPKQPKPYISTHKQPTQLFGMQPSAVGWKHRTIPERFIIHRPTKSSFTCASPPRRGCQRYECQAEPWTVRAADRLQRYLPARRRDPVGLRPAFSGV